ncbi:hypothetical protein RAS1_30720 [Phycisphaerae bacterium RAS1]|nr:hypothetical protein RAS1_30720 [Phycisphaerae bacterium RAS1]
MASPTTCGVGALLLQDFRAQFPGEPDFRNSTLKILLAHTAVDLGTPGPDFQFGYGSIRGQAAVDFMRTGNFAENSVPGTGNSVNYVVVVQPGDTLMKVTIAWDDPPGTPNVSPALVNDLDLVVTSPGGTRFYPWTHGGLANPAAAAVQTQENHLDNIEQVLVNNPQVGSWQIEVRGTAVPSGPQPFSIAAGPFLVNCSSIGSISLNADEYNCSSSATLRVVDCDLNTDAGAIETVNVTINSTSEPAGETVLLTEVAPDGATFVGTISLSTTNAAGVLQIAHADTVTATYLDASDGQGGFNIARTDTATVDCVGPIISNVQVINLAAHSATVTFNTDETAQGTVRYGTACGSLSSTSQGSANTVSHSFSLSGLTDNTTYFFAADAVDPAGNASSDDNGGQCFTFTTPEIPDYFTQLFSTALGTNDLDNQQFLFVPNGTVDRYAACREPNMTQFPTDPSGHMPIVFPGTQDDQFVAITLTGGQQVLLYGVPYSTFYVGSNGYITFNSGDTDNTESLTDHFEQPHISLLFDNLNPATAGQVSWAQLADRAVVTFNNVAEDVTTNPPLNSFQCEMFYDGRIRVTFLNVGITDGLFGLSAGQTTPADYTPSDFTLYGACGPRPPTATGSTVGTPAGAPVLIELIASDDGLPAPPALTYTILSLPAFGVLSDPNGGPINAVPYTLIAGGDTVRYGPPGIQSGTVTFDFKANDGGVPPEGGDSGTATVTVNIADPNTPQPIHEFLVDDTQPAGWTWDADWAFGDPAGLSGDPQTGFTGVNVLGYNLNGAYPNSLAPVRYLRTTAIDCTNLSQVTLQFMRWLGIESATFDHATIDASTDGMAWTNVWTHTGETLNNPTSWTMVSYSLAAIADDQPTVYLRWGMGTTDVSVAYCGWNIDDILILGVLPGGTLLGDLNCDGEVNILDINAFILAITDPAAYAAAYPDCNINLADCNGDGDENILDINPFISLLGG